MISRLAERVREYRKQRHLRALVRQGLRIGRNVQIEGDIFFDPSHCFLITVEDDCRFGPGVQLLAHESGMFPFLGITRIGRICICRKSFIGMSAVVFPGVTIGPCSIVGAHSVVMKDVPPHTVAAGIPARPLCSLEDYLRRHRELQERSQKFPEADYRLGVITEERKREMLNYLQKNRAAYMQGDTPDVSIYNL